MVSPFPDSYFSHNPQDYMDRYLDREVSLCAQNGMYAIIDHHEFYDTASVTHDRMMNFWRAVSARYAGYDHVIYELFNEPHQGTWPPLTALYEEATDIIRANDPDAVVIANGLQWGYDIHYALTDPVARPNVAYGTHPYPGKFNLGDRNAMRNAWDYGFGDVSEIYPVIVTEVGWTPDGSGREWDASNEEFGTYFMQYLREKDIGYSILGFTNGFCCNLLSTLDPDYTPSAMGTLIKADLQTP
jgi:hypothetical protein